MGGNEERDEMVENMCGACPRKGSSGSELALQLGRKSARTDRFSSQDSENHIRRVAEGWVCVLLHPGVPYILSTWFVQFHLFISRINLL